MRSFCNNPEYEDFTSSYWNGAGRFKIMLHMTNFSRILRCDNAFWNYIIMLDYRENSYIEEYQNIFDLNMLVWYPEEPIQNRRNWIEDMGDFEIAINHIKYFITDNKFYYKSLIETKNDISSKSKRKHVKIFNDTKKTIEWFYNGDYDLKKSEIKKLLKFTQTQKKNNYLQYIFFLNVVTNINLFIVFNPYRHSYIITDSDWMVENSWTCSIIINIRDILNKQLSSRLLNHAMAIRERYNQFNWNTIKQVMKDIQDAIKTDASLKIKIDVQKWKVNYLDINFREQNVDKYYLIKEQTEKSEVNHVAVEKYNGKPTAVVWHSRKKYK